MSELDGRCGKLASARASLFCVFFFGGSFGVPFLFDDASFNSGFFQHFGFLTVYFSKSFPS